MDNRELIKSMINNMINGNTTEAELDHHNYFAAKMREVAGITQPQQETEVVVDTTVD